MTGATLALDVRCRVTRLLTSSSGATAERLRFALLCTLPPLDFFFRFLLALAPLSATSTGSWYTCTFPGMRSNGSSNP